MTIYILYSADYELFLGGNFCDEKEVLIAPTNDLLNLFDRLGIPLTLFADIFSILRYKELNKFSFPEHAEKQLKEAIRRGHDVQSHVHPHWNYTQIEGTRYTIDADYFLLGNLDTDKEALYTKILSYLVTSRDYLQNLLRQINKNYCCIAFRSGGYGLQPNSTIIIKALIDSGFIIDSSIVPNFIFKSNVNEINFSMVPKMANYYLDNDLSIPSNKNQGIFEIPIASCNFSIMENGFSHIIILLKFLQNKIMFGKTKGITFNGYPIQQINKPSEHSKYYTFIKSFNNRFYHLDCSTDEKKMFQCTKKYLKQFDCINSDIFFSCNMHPKVMTKDHFAALEKYHAALNAYYPGNIQAICYQQAADMVLRKIQ